MSDNKTDITVTKAYEATLVIPTYDLKAENKNPCFENQYGIAYIYPYSLLDDYSTTSRSKTYRSLHIENRYLKVTVLPELGGRIYSVYDKLSKCEVFYKNSVIKFAPLSVRGAFFSGGIEINFPIGHAVTGTETINWHLRDNSDGSASIVYGAIEHLSGMKWTVTLTLFPDRCALAQDVQIQNPTSIPGRYFYWCTPACEANDQTEFIYPFRRCRSYMWDGEVSWPNARIDLTPIGGKLETYVGVPTWPWRQIHKPIDLHWEKNILVQASVFGSDVKHDFYGLWQHSKNHGYAHVADRRDISGMKHWSWGSAGMSLMTQTSLTDDGSRYAETQCGLMSNQHDFDYLTPYQTYQWREWWLPLRGIGGLTCANSDIGASFKLAKIDQDGSYVLSLAVCPTRNYDQVTIKLFIPGKTIVEKDISVSPENPWQTTVTIDPKELKNHPIHLSIADENGIVILDHVQERDAFYKPSNGVDEEGKSKKADDLFQKGFKHEKLEQREEAMQTYLETIALDRFHGLSHLQLGLMHLRAANFEMAADHLQKAAEAGRVEANYYLGFLKMSQQKWDEARKLFMLVPDGISISAASICGVGCISLRLKKWEEAIKYFKKAMEEDPSSITASLLNAIALRCSGRADEAITQLLKILDEDPINHVAIRELTILYKEENKHSEYQAKLARLLVDDRQYILDLASFYMNAGLNDDALSILLEGAKNWNYPILAYIIADLYQKMGKNSESNEWLDRGSKWDPDLVFPSRLVEIEALNKTIQARPNDYKAHYYIGNFLYAHQRYEDAIKFWEQASEGLPSFDVIHRNLGLAYWKRHGNLTRATSSFEKAIELNPLNQDIYIHLDDLYLAQKLANKREKLVEKMLRIQEPRHDVQKRLVTMLVDLNHYEHAIQLLTQDYFLPLEMDQSFRNTYVRAYLKRAEAFIEAGNIEAAIADYKQARKYPDNVGVGQPVASQNAEILYRLGCAYELLGKFDEALDTWQEAAEESHLEGSSLYPYILMSLDKINGFTRIGYSR